MPPDQPRVSRRLLIGGAAAAAVSTTAAPAPCGAGRRPGRGHGRAARRRVGGAAGPVGTGRRFASARAGHRAGRLPPRRPAAAAPGGRPGDRLRCPPGRPDRLRTGLQRGGAPAGERGGGVVLVPRGTYRLSSPVFMHWSNVVLRGAGRDATVLHFTRPLDDGYRRSGSPTATVAGPGPADRSGSSRPSGGRASEAEDYAGTEGWLLGDALADGRRGLTGPADAARLRHQPAPRRRPGGAGVREPAGREPAEASGRRHPRHETVRLGAPGAAARHRFRRPVHPVRDAAVAGPDRGGPRRPPGPAGPAAQVRPAPGLAGAAAGDRPDRPRQRCRAADRAQRADRDDRAQHAPRLERRVLPGRPRLLGERGTGRELRSRLRLHLGQVDHAGPRRGRRPGRASQLRLPDAVPRQPRRRLRDRALHGAVAARAPSTMGSTSKVSRRETSGGGAGWPRVPSTRTGPCRSRTRGPTSPWSTTAGSADRPRPARCSVRGWRTGTSGSPTAGRTP